MANRGLLAPGSQQDPPTGEHAHPAYPHSVAAPAPPAPAPAVGYSAPMTGPMDDVPMATPVDDGEEIQYGGGNGKGGAPHQHQHQHQPGGGYGQHQPYGHHVPQPAPPQQHYAAPPPPMTGNVNKPAPQVVTSPPYRDVAFMVAFLIHVGLIFILAFALGVPAINRVGKETTDVDLSDTHPIIGLLVVAGIVGGVVSGAWFLFLQRNAASIITCTLWTSVVMELICAVAVMFISPGAGVLFLFLAALTLCYVYSVKNRIPFASATLKTACEAVRAHQQVVYVAFGAMVLQVLWIVFWSMAFFGVEANSTDDGYICEFFMLISFFWGLLVIKNIVHCTASGTVGSWWFVANPESPVMGALKRACTTSLGSICLGSLIVAVLKALRAMIDAARRGARRNGNNGGAFLLACASCLVGCVERAMQFFNHWAFVQVALYGKDFRSAGRDAIRVFEDRGWTLIINDNLIDRALVMGCLMVGCVTALVGGGWALAMVDESGWVFAGAFLSFIVGFGMCLIWTSVIDSAVATVFVCFAEHPDALAMTHPGHLNSLVAAWQRFHPQAFSRAGYDVRFGRPTPAGAV